MRRRETKRGVYVLRSTKDSKTPEYVVVEHDEVWFQEKFNGRTIGVVGILVLFRTYQCLACKTMAMQMQLFQSKYSFVGRVVTIVTKSEEIA